LIDAITLEATQMLNSNNDDLSLASASPAGTGRTNKILSLLDELLTHSIRLRDLYKKVRWQTSDIRFHHLRQLVDSHYREQLRLVDVLVDRIRTLGGTDRLFAGVFLQGTQFAYALRGRASPIRWLRDLLDAHESVLSAARSGAKSDTEEDNSMISDFAVGQVVVANDLQSGSVSEQLMRREGFEKPQL
jgi:starvation-inducible DNA-binding protein